MLLGIAEELDEVRGRADLAESLRGRPPNVLLGIGEELDEFRGRVLGCGADFSESIRGRRVGCYFAVKDDGINAGGIYVPDQPCTVDGPIITARVPDDLPIFLKAILAALEE